MVKDAVILAAGMGTRLQNVLKNVPKGFLELDGKSLIEYSIEKLMQSGIERIIIVTGHLSEYYEGLAKIYPAIETVKNEVFATSGSMYSLWTAKDLISADFLLLESDLIYESRALSELQNLDKDNAILLSGATNSGDEVYAETCADKLVNLKKDPTLLKSITGELVGISKISLAMYQQLVTVGEKMFDCSLKVEYEECIVQTAKMHPVFFHKIEDLVWAEIDDASHLNRVKTQILPKLR